MSSENIIGMGNITNIRKEFLHCYQYSQTDTAFCQLVQSAIINRIVGDFTVNYDFILSYTFRTSVSNALE